MARDPNDVERFSGATCVQETAKAILVRLDDEEHTQTWIPKSVIHDDSAKTLAERIVESERAWSYDDDPAPWCKPETLAAEVSQLQAERDALRALAHEVNLILGTTRSGESDPGKLMERIDAGIIKLSCSLVYPAKASPIPPPVQPAPAMHLPAQMEELRGVLEVARSSAVVLAEVMPEGTRPRFTAHKIVDALNHALRLCPVQHDVQQDGKAVRP